VATRPGTQLKAIPGPVWTPWALASPWGYFSPLFYLRGPGRLGRLFDLDDRRILLLKTRAGHRGTDGPWRTRHSGTRGLAKGHLPCHDGYPTTGRDLSGCLSSPAVGVILFQAPGSLLFFFGGASSNGRRWPKGHDVASSARGQPGLNRGFRGSALFEGAPVTRADTGHTWMALGGPSLSALLRGLDRNYSCLLEFWDPFFVCSFFFLPLTRLFLLTVLGTRLRVA